MGRGGDAWLLRYEQRLLFVVDRKVTLVLPTAACGSGCLGRTLRCVAVLVQAHDAQFRGHVRPLTYGVFGLRQRLLRRLC